MVDWQQIDTVLLDMDGTLLDLHFDNHFWLEHLPKRYAELRAMPEDLAREQLYRQFAAQRGTLQWYCLDYWSDTLDVDIVALKQEVDGRIDFLPEVKAFLAAIRSSGRRSTIVTNAHHDSVALKTEATGIDKLVDGVYSSHSFGYPKEHQAFWPALQRALPHDPSRTVLMDDNADVLHAARQYGIRHLVRPLKPDSQKDAIHCTQFIGVNQLSELLPL